LETKYTIKNNSKTVFIQITLKLLVLFIALFVNKYVFDFRIDQKMILKLFSIFLIFLYFLKIFAGNVIIFKKNKINFLIFLFFLSLTFSLLYSKNMMVALHDYNIFISYVFILFLIINYIQSDETIDSFITLFAITSGIISLYTILQYYNLDPYLYNITILTSTIGQKNWISNYIGLFLPVVLSLFLIEKKFKYKIAYFVLFAFNYTTILICQSRGIWISILATILIAIYIIVRFKPLKISGVNKLWSILLVMIILMITFIYSNDNPLNNSEITVKERAIKTFDKEDVSINNHLLQWITTLEMIKDKPILGSGIGNFKMEYLKYQAEYLKNNPKYTKYSLKVSEAHNEYLQLAAECGLIGLANFIVIIFMLYKSIWMCFNSKINEIKKIKLLGMILGISCFLIHSLFTFPLHVPTLGTSFFVLFGLTLNYSQKLNYKELENKYITINVKKILKNNKAKIIIISLFFITIAYISDVWIIRPYIAEIYYYKGLEEFQSKNYLNALNNFEYSVKLNSYNGRTLNALGTANLNLKMIDEAEINFKNALKYRIDPIIYCNLGVVYSSKNEKEKAEEAFKQSIYYMPKYFPSYVKLANLYDLQKEYDKELAILWKIIEIDHNIPEKPIIFYRIGLTYQKKNMTDKALEYFLKALELVPEGSPVIEEIENEINKIYKSSLQK